MRPFSLECRQNDFLVLAEQLELCQFAAARNRTIDSRLSEHELSLPGSDYPSLASSAWDNNTDIMQLQIIGEV